MPEDLKTEKANKKPAKQEFVFAVGRRRAAVARVRLYQKVKDGLLYGEQVVKAGSILVNQQPVEAYFSSPVAKAIYQEPLKVANVLDKYGITIKVEGGGPQGQLIAVVNGIARALVALDKDKFRPILKKRGFLTRDARVRERRKVGTGGKARRKKQSPKR